MTHTHYITLQKNNITQIALTETRHVDETYCDCQSHTAYAHVFVLKSSNPTWACVLSVWLNRRNCSPRSIKNSGQL